MRGASHPMGRALGEEEVQRRGGVGACDRPMKIEGGGEVIAPRCVLLST